MQAGIGALLVVIGGLGLTLRFRRQVRTRPTARKEERRRRPWDALIILLPNNRVAVAPQVIRKKRGEEVVWEVTNDGDGTAVAAVVFDTVDPAPGPKRTRPLNVKQSDAVRARVTGRKGRYPYHVTVNSRIADDPELEIFG